MFDAFGIVSVIDGSLRKVVDVPAWEHRVYLCSSVVDLGFGATGFPVSIEGGINHVWH